MTCQTLGLISSPKPPCATFSSDECKLLLSEPNLPAILRYNCCSKLTCGAKGALRVYGVDGTTVDVVGFSGCEGCQAQLPLYVSYRYLGPLPAELEHVRKLNMWLCGEAYANSIQVDSFIPLVGVACKVKLGCSKARYASMSEGFSVRQLYPRLILGRSYSKLNIRVKRSLAVEAPWLCVEGGNRYTALLCLEKSKPCSFEVTAYGDVRVVSGRVASLEAPKCPEVPLAKAYLHGLLYESGNINVKPCVWSRTGLLVVGWAGVREEDTIELTLAVWNPYPRPRLHSLSFEQHRILKAWLIKPDATSETLAASYNQLRIPLPTHGLRIVKLKLAKLPPLLLKR